MSERERATDAELESMLVDNQKNGDAYLTAREARLLIAELRERRAADRSTAAQLTAEEIEALRHACDVVERDVYERENRGGHAPRGRAALTVLENLTKGGEK